MHEANSVYNYWSCVAYESNPRIKAIWERFLDYELGKLQTVMELFKKHERRDPAEILPENLPDPIEYKSQREFVRDVLEKELDYRAVGKEFVPSSDQESEASRNYRDQLNSEGVPTEIITAGYVWKPGTELSNIQEMKH